MELQNVSLNFSTWESATVANSSDLLVSATDVTSSSVSVQQSTTDFARVLSDDVIFRPGVTAVFIAVYGAIAVPAIFGNLLVLLVMACHPALRSQHTNIYVINLAVCDLMVVAAECPFIVIQFLIRGETARAFFSDAVCGATFFMNGFFGTVSILTMLAIGVERYCAVIHPLQVLGEKTATRAKSIVFFFWAFSTLTHLGQLVIFGHVETVHYINHSGQSFDMTICMSVRPEKQHVYSHVYASTVFILIYGSTFSTTLILYIRILRHLKKRKQISPDQIMGNNSHQLRSGSHRHHHGRRDGIQRRKSVAPKTCIEAIQKTSRMLSCSILSYLICYTLYFYLNLYYIYYGLALRSGIALIVLANLFGALNSLINPVVFAVFVDQFRVAFSDILSRRSWWRSRTPSGLQSSVLDRRSRAKRRLTPKPRRNTNSARELRIPLATITGGGSTNMHP